MNQNQTIRVLLSGCGRMGRLVGEEAAENENFSPVYGVDAFLPDGLPFPVVGTFDAVDASFDVVIDYSNSAVFDALADFVQAQKKPLVLCTTGLSDAQLERVRQLAESVPVFFSANMSVGVYVLSAIAKKAAALLGTDFDIEIQEAHHRNKVDAPSGTALTLAREIQSARPDLDTLSLDRTAVRQKRSSREIGVSCSRGGSLPGKHTVMYAGEDEVLELTHTAYSPKIFASGALRAAAFLMGKPAGLYGMSDLLEI